MANVSTIHSNLFDCHVHTHFSTDSDADVKEICTAAESLGLRGLIFTDHNDFDWPFEESPDEYQLPLETYENTLSSIVKSYNGPLDIRIGVEQGLQHSCCDRINSYDSKKKLDFIIGSSHLVEGKDPYYPSFWEGKDVTKSINLYLDTILDNLDCCHNFDVYGHIDYITRYIPDSETRAKTNLKDCQDVIDAILKKIITLGKGIELNTAGFKSGDEPNPRRWILSRYRELGGEIITLGSDAHTPDRIGDHFELARQILIDCGFKNITVFKKRKPEFISIL